MTGETHYERKTLKYSEEQLLNALTEIKSARNYE